MKKKIILVVAVLAILITLICIPKTTYQKWFGKTPNDNPVDTNKEYQTIFVVDEKNKLVGLKVPVEEIEEDQIAQKWNLLTSQMNKIPQGYSSPITPSTVLNDYKIEDNKLILNVSEDILRSSGRLAIESLAWTFCNDEIKEVVLKVENDLKEELKESDKHIFVRLEKVDSLNEVISVKESQDIISMMYLMPNGFMHKSLKTCHYDID